MNLSDLIELRQDIHKNAEGGFEVYQTQEKVKQKLISYGLDERYIKSVAKSGL